MQSELQPFIAAALAVTLLAACGKRGEEDAAVAPAAEQQTAQPGQTTTEQGTTTMFGESSPEPQQSPTQ